MTAKAAHPSSTGSISATQAAQWLRGLTHVCVLTHVKPDGDAVGSTLALVRTLNTLRPGSASAWYFGPKVEWFDAIAENAPARFASSAADLPALDDPSSGVAILDTGSWSQLEPVRAYLAGKQGRTLIVDHHARIDEDVAARRLVDVSAAAACQVVAPVCVALLGTGSASELPAPVARALYMGLGTDTGWFRHSNVSPAVFELAASLLRAGVDHSDVYARIEQNERLSRLKLTAKALGSLELLEQGQIAVMTLSTQDFRDCGSGSSQSGGLIDLPMVLSSVRVSVLVTEADAQEYGAGAAGPLTKVSLRSKPGPGAIDVNQIAGQFGGGGHARAAGAKLTLSPAEARGKIIESLRAAL